MKNKLHNKIFIQVGFPKTATTTLQREIYPRLCANTRYTYWRDDPDLESLIKRSKYRAEMGYDCGKIDIPDFTLISLESLIHPDPRRWESQAYGNKLTFGDDAHILIVLREPRSYLSSIYTQMCLHSGLAQNPEHFFLTKDEYSEHFPAPVFSIDEFSYKRVIKIYREHFKNVTIVKLEELPELRFIDDFFEVNEIEFENMKRIFDKKRHNKGFSKRMVKTLFFLSRVLALVGFSFGQNLVNSSVEIFRDDYRNKPQISYRNKFTSLIISFFKRNIRRLNWYLIFKTFDRLFPSKRFKLEFNKLSYININKLEEEYSSIPKYKTYTRE